MVKKYVIIFLIMGLLLVSLSLLAKNNVKDDYNTRTDREEVKSIDDFEQFTDLKEVNFNGNYTINLEQSSKPALKITGNNLKYLDVYIEDDCLYITTKTNHKNILKSSDIDIQVSIPELRKITADGVIDLSNVNAIKGKNLSIDFNGVGSFNLNKLDYEVIKLNVNGTGEAKLNGQTNKLALDLTGIGSIDTQNLKAYNCIARNSGIGLISLYAENELKAYIEGLGSIEYLGNPQVQKKINGLGSVDRID